MESLTRYRLPIVALLFAIGIAPGLPVNAQSPAMARTADDFIRALGPAPEAKSGRVLRGGGRTPRGVEQIVDDPATASYQTLADNLPLAAALIHFDFDSARLRADAYAVLDELVRALHHDTLANVQLMIVGHTDSQGSEVYNLDLSQRRAGAVKDYLVSRGVSPQRLLVRGLGESHPIATNSSAHGRALNRRSEFIRLGQI